MLMDTNYTTEGREAEYIIKMNEKTYLCLGYNQAKQQFEILKERSDEADFLEIYKKTNIE